MTTIVVLTETAADPAALRLPGADLPGLHARLVSEITTHLTAAHAALLAQPLALAGGWRWQTAGDAVRRFADLSPENRTALLTVCGSILSDIRRLAESGEAPAVSQAWPALRLVPNFNAIYAVDGHPVLTQWGHAPDGGVAPLFDPYDDGVSWRATPRPPWAVYGVALACVALFALAAGLLLPWAAQWAVPEPAMCQVEPGQLAALRTHNDALERGEELKRLLASLGDDVGRAQLRCPVPTTPPRSTPPPPSPHVELPRDQWDKHDLSMLEGCWHNTTQMITKDVRTQVREEVQEWKLCFDRRGRGQQSIRWPSGKACTGPLSASFSDDNSLVLTDTQRCQRPGLFLYQGKMECQRISDTEADCVRIDTEGPAAGTHQQGRFKR